MSVYPDRDYPDLIVRQDDFWFAPDGFDVWSVIVLVGDGTPYGPTCTTIYDLLMAGF